MVEASPLHWPAGWPRTPKAKRTAARFSTRGVRSYQVGGSTHSYAVKQQLTIATALDRVLAEVSAFGVRRQDVVISTNLRLKIDGLPYSGQKEPEDPGAAVYWVSREGQPQCIASDRYTRVADNLAALAASLDALRALERHGGAEILNRAFQGFKALPGGEGAAVAPVLTLDTAARRIAEWADVEPQDVLRVKSTFTLARRIALSKTHPDTGGSDAEFQAAQDAIRLLEQANPWY